MAFTYLDIINIALRDINEVPMTQAAFDNPRGIQATAKEMVSRAYLDVLNHSKEWPFLSAKGSVAETVTTVTGQQEYDFASSLDSVDWDSFFIKNSASTYAEPLQTIDYDFYIKHMKNSDVDNTDGGRPLFVFRLKDKDSFGISPIPDDDTYTITFSAWSVPSTLSAATDEIAIPDRYYNVLLSKVRYYLWMFRENSQQASMADRDFKVGIEQMHRDLVEKQSINMRAV